MDKLMIFARRAVATTYNSSSTYRCYCSHPSSSNNKLFVAGLSWSVDERSLMDAFSNFGEVSEVRIMYDKDTGRSRGFGFVYFSKDEDAKSAKDAMDGKAILGRPMRISFALEKAMGNKPAKAQSAQVKDVILVKVPPPIDPALGRWLSRDIQKIEEFTVENPRSLKPPDHYVEYMRLYGWLDLDLDDPDLAPLFK